jgi:hypothetical protein
MLIQLRSNPVADLPRQGRTCEAIRKFDLPEFRKDWF